MKRAIEREAAAESLSTGKLVRTVLAEGLIDNESATA